MTGSDQDIAIVAVNKKGALLGRRLANIMAGSDLYVPEKLSGPGEHAFLLPASRLIAQIFGEYRSLVLIMAAGIAVRLIAPRVKDKRQDPGVVVLDTGGTFAVSLLSGHLGGANELAQKIAASLGAQPVITTASDRSGTIAADLLGREYGWEIENGVGLKALSAALVDDEPVGVFQDAGERDWQLPDLPPNITVYDSLQSLALSGASSAIVITDRLLAPDALNTLPPDTVIYRPKCLVLGIGCNRGTPAAIIEAAIINIVSENSLSIKSVKKIATIDVKKDEAGIIELAEKYRWPVEYHTREALDAAGSTRPSEMVKRSVGTVSVSEASARLSGGEVIVPKTAYRGAVTVAVARLLFPLPETVKKGKLFLVGIGPGSPEQMTAAAMQAIKKCRVIAGYDAYIEIIRPLLSGQKIIASGMREEIERARAAIAAARSGETVALVCSGDSGVYGMAGLIGEILAKDSHPVDVEVVPGVTSLVACAALLGAPLSMDFASISLSDYLVPEEEITRRLEMAAQGDFVIALYNPASRSRRQTLAGARDILMRYRKQQTPVGVVTNAFRPGQRITITDLEHMLECEIGMNTTIIIGNSGTFTSHGWMITPPRGYQKKYTL